MITNLVLLNTFSPNMLGRRETAINWQPVTLNYLARLLESTSGSHTSHISQNAICRILWDKVISVSPWLKEELLIRASKAPYFVSTTDTIIQIQYVGPTIENNDLSLPKGGQLHFWEMVPMIKMSSFQDKEGTTYSTYEL